MENTQKEISRRELLAAVGASAMLLSAGSLMGATPNFTQRTTRFNVMSFGAVGDGIHDDTSAIQHAISAAEDAGGELEFPPCPVHYTSSGLIISRPITIYGSGSNVIIAGLPTTKQLFKVCSGLVKVSRLSFDMAATPDEAILFYLDTSVKSLHHIYLNDLSVSETGRFLQDADGDGVIVHLHVSHISCRLNRGTSILLNDAFAYVYFTNVNIDNVPVVAAGKDVDFPGIVVQHAQGLHFEKCDVTGGNGLPRAHGFHLMNCEAVHFNTCMADYVGGDGFRFENVWYLYLVATVSSLCSLNGLYMKECRFVNGSNVTTAGRSKMPDPRPRAHGIVGLSSSDLVFSTVSSRFNNGDGVRLIDCQRTSWSTLHLFDNEGFGLQERPDKPGHQGFNTLFNVIFKANRAGNFKTLSSSTHVGQAVLDSGELRVADQGPFAC